MHTTEQATIRPRFNGEGMVSFQAAARAAKAQARWAVFTKAPEGPKPAAPAPVAPTGAAPTNLRVLRDLLSLAQKS